MSLSLFLFSFFSLLSLSSLSIQFWLKTASQAYQKLMANQTYNSRTLYIFRYIMNVLSNGVATGMILGLQNGCFAVPQPVECSQSVECSCVLCSEERASFPLSPKRHGRLSSLLASRNSGRPPTFWLKY